VQTGIIGKSIMVGYVQPVQMVVQLVSSQVSVYHAYNLITSTATIVYNVQLTVWNVMMGQPAQAVLQVF